MSPESADELRRLAAAFADAAANPAPTPLPAKWVEGFTDGLRFCAAAVTVIADGRPTVDALQAAMAVMA